jgi:hypothetical protein
MRELYLDDRGLEMTRTQESTASSAAARGAAFDGPGPGDGDGAGGVGRAAGLQGRHVCPFCGSVNDAIEGPCPRCTMENTAETRKATKSRIGPWYVLQSRNPAAPGMTHDTLLGFVRKGRVKARSIVRGPTTHQLWRFACQVRGLSREFGVCYSCGGVIARETHLCPQCNRPQDPPADPDVFLEGQGTGGAPAGMPAAMSVPIPAPAPAPVPVPVPAPAPATAATPGVGVARADEPRAPVYRELKIPPVTVGDDIVVPPLAGGATAGVVPVPAAPPTGTFPAPDARPAADPRATVLPDPTPPRAAPAPQSRQQPEPAPAPAPSAPATSTGGPAGRRKANDVFLSAKDLAAAFQLDFKPDAADADSGAADAAYSRSMAAGGADTALPWPPRRRRKRRVGRTVLLLLLLAAGGLGAAVALIPALRQQTVDWANNKYQSLTGANLYPDIASRPRATTAPAGPVRQSAQQSAQPASGQRQPTPTPAGTTTTTTARVTASATDTVPPAVAVAGSKAPGEAVAGPRPSAQAPPEPQRQVVRPRQEPARVSPPSVATDDSSAEVSPGDASSGDVSSGKPPVATPSPVVDRPPAATRPPAPASRPVVVATQPARAAAPAPAPVPPAPRLTLQDAQQKAKAWYGQALDADADGDLAKATKLYKRIMDQLPPKIDGQDVWPSDVKLRYDEAAKVLGAK